MTIILGALIIVPTRSILAYLVITRCFVVHLIQAEFKIRREFECPSNFYNCLTRSCLD